MFSLRVGIAIVFLSAVAPADALRTLKAQQTQNTGPAILLRVAAVQMRSTRSLSDNIIAIDRSIQKCAAAGARVVLFPECALTGYFDDVVKKISEEQLLEAEHKMAASCRRAGIYAVIGTPWRSGKKLYNSATVIDPSGKVKERYHKIQLAESWPQAGDHLAVLKMDNVPCSIIICHDERYPELVRLPVLAGARVIFYLSHESPLRAESKIGPYRAQIQARAAENTVFVVQANAPANLDGSGSHGQSRIVAPDGNLINEASLFGEDVLSATLDLDRATGANAKMSLCRGPLTDWWKQGIKLVRRID